jgi:hypothetical protein
MNFDHFIAQMATNAETIQQLAKGVSDEQARWKPNAESWSIVEVINHLYDEEHLDFRTRLDHILHKPGVDPPQIDPDGWVTVRTYNKRQLDQSVNNFLQERKKSLTWLRGLDSPDWEAAYFTPRFSICAGDMFAAWVVHDLLHIRQLTELHYMWTAKHLHPYSVKYAGTW